MMISPVCLFCGRNASQTELEPANLLAQPGVWSCTDHERTDGWVNWPHTKAPFDLGYPSKPTVD
jgi:hypothetical protein